MQNQIVAHLLDGGVVKGVAFDVDPAAKPRCHVKTEAGVVEVKLSNLKALFFVKSLAGDRTRTDAQDLDPTDTRRRGATMIEIRFRDGERIVGLTNRYPPRGQFFFVVPVDPDSNNTRILVNQAAVASVEPTGMGSAIASS